MDWRITTRDATLRLENEIMGIENEGGTSGSIRTSKREGYAEPFIFQLRKGKLSVVPTMIAKLEVVDLDSVFPHRESLTDYLLLALISPYFA